MTRRQEPKPFAGKVKEKLTALCAPEQLEALARQYHFVQRATSKLTGADFFALGLCLVARKVARIAPNNWTDEDFYTRSSYPQRP